MKLLSMALLGLLWVTPVRADVVTLDRDLVLQLADIIAHPAASRDKLFETMNQLNACIAAQAGGNPQTCPDVAKAQQDQHAALLKAMAEARAAQKAEDEQAARKGP